MPSAIDVIGKIFGRLTVTGNVVHQPGKRRRVTCLCVCGKTIKTEPRFLRSGHCGSCGCGQRDAVSISTKLHHTTHGMSRTPEYNTWIKIKDRCENPISAKYSDYGARGISVCEKWRDDFSAFLEDMGKKPSHAHSIERKDVNGNYAPSNCVWATAKEQARNRRNHRFVELDGVRMPLSAACEAAGIKYRSALWRINAGKEWRPLPPAPDASRSRREGEL